MLSLGVILKIGGCGSKQYSAALSLLSIPLDKLVYTFRVVCPGAGRTTNALTGWQFFLDGRWLHNHAHLLPIRQACIDVELNSLAVDDTAKDSF